MIMEKSSSSFSSNFGNTCISFSLKKYISLFGRIWPSSTILLIGSLWFFSCTVSSFLKRVISSWIFFGNFLSSSYSDIFFLIGVITVFCISFPTTFPAFPLSPKNCPAAPFKSPFTILFPISFSSFFPFLICSAVMSDVISLSGSNWA